MTKKTSGTFEWAVATVNCSVRCYNNCAYCYSRRLAAKRGDISSYSEWNKNIETRRNLAKENKLYKGTVMFPSAHDIFEDNLDVCIDVLANLLEAGNKVLITTKPRIPVILELCETFKEYKHKILFRFTIGTSNEKILQLWEPGAPTFKERFACLALAAALGFQTSVSMEPMLDSVSVVEDAKLMFPFVTDGVWIGKMNKIEDRVTGIPAEEKERIRAGQTDEEIHRIYNKLKYEPKVRWKESFKTILGLEVAEEPGTDK
jgi:DNA repair photolyase